MKTRVVKTYSELPEPYYQKGLDIYHNGADNLYPETMENLINSSPTATQCASLYESFLTGNGFLSHMKEVNLSDNFYQVTYLEDLLDDIAHSVSRHRGAFVHVNYNALCQIESLRVLPFYTCRLGKKESSGFISSVRYSPKGWGMDMDREKIEKIDAFNPLAEVIEAQVEKAKGWENYRGQIKFFTLDRHSLYPRSPLEVAYLHADVENKLGSFYSSVVHRGFENISYIRHRPFEDPMEREAFLKGVNALSGFENAHSKLIIEDKWDEQDPEGSFKIHTIPNETKADKYAHFEASCANFIRKAFKNIPPQLIDYVQGKLGNTSGEDLKVANALYNAAVAKDRNKISRLFSELFAHFKETINPSGNWEIAQHAIADDGTSY